MSLLLTVLFDASIVVSLLVGALYWFYQRRFKYWSKRNVPHTKPTFPLGDFSGISRTKSFAMVANGLYEQHETEPFIGAWLMAQPILIARDPELIKHILIKDFSHFHDRGVNFNEKIDPLEGHLFGMNGLEWRNLRIKLTPTFTSGKMKQMFPIVLECSDLMIKVMKETAQINDTIEAKTSFAKYTMDVIARCAFGLSISCQTEENNEFFLIGQRLAKPTFFENMVNVLNISSPGVRAFFKLRILPKWMSDYFLNTVRDTVNYRQTNNVSRTDFLQLLMQLMEKGYIEDADALKSGNQEKEYKIDDKKEFTLEQAAAQAFLFFFAGFETSSTTMQFAMYELARNQVIQDKLRTEVNKVIKKHNGAINYDGVQEMEYMEQVFEETLRKYPVASPIVRECTKEYPIPGTDVVLDKGVLVMCPVEAIQNDPKYFPKPDEFDPDRFSTEAKQSRNEFTYFPFGEGPRICIGNRFAQMQSKTGLAALVHNFKFTLSNKTSVPLKMDPTAALMAPLGGIYLNVTKV